MLTSLIRCIAFSVPYFSVQREGVEILYFPGEERQAPRATKTECLHGKGLRGISSKEPVP